MRGRGLEPDRAPPEQPCQQQPRAADARQDRADRVGLDDVADHLVRVDQVVDRDEVEARAELLPEEDLRDGREADRGHDAGRDGEPPAATQQPRWTASMRERADEQGGRRAGEGEEHVGRRAAQQDVQDGPWREIDVLPGQRGQHDACHRRRGDHDQPDQPGALERGMGAKQENALHQGPRSESKPRCWHRRDELRAAVS